MTPQPEQKSETPELKPCPFCNNPNPQICQNGIGDYYVQCTDNDGDIGCFARTSDVKCESENHAAERWNTRLNYANSTKQNELEKALREVECFNWAMSNLEQFREIIWDYYDNQDDRQLVISKIQVEIKGQQ